jgi:predicted metal-dependent HD superfamily phosphohydrolase
LKKSETKRTFAVRNIEKSRFGEQVGVLLKSNKRTHNMTTPSSPVAAMTDPHRYLLDAARQHVLGLWNEKRDRRLVYHSFSQTAEIVRLVTEIGAASQQTREVIETAQLAAWFHTTGYLFDYQQFVEKSAVAAEFFLAERRFEPAKIHRVRQCILTALTGIQPKPAEAQLLCDAITAVNLTTDFEQNSPLLRLEWELAENRKLTEQEWQEFLLQTLLNAHFYLPSAKISYEPAVARQFLKNRQLVDNQAVVSKKATENGLEPDRFAKLGKNGLRSGIQTFYRSNYANHIHLSAIADNKAHILIQINSILLSVAVSLLTWREGTTQNPMMMLPLVIFVVSGTVSLIFAVLSARPKVTNVNNRMNPEMTKKNIVFFGNFVHLTIEQYEQQLDEMLRDGRLLYGNMTRDMYHLGKVLDKKYRFLHFAYNVFMIGFVVTVALFLVVYFMK